MLKLQWLASIWWQNYQKNPKYESYRFTMNCIDLTTNDQKCLVTSQNIENNSKLQKWSNYDEFASIWSRNDKNIDLRRKQFKTTQSYKTYQSTMNCIDWMTKRSNQRKTTKAIELRWIASISRQNEQKCWVTSQTVQNNAKLQKRSNYYEFASIWRQKDRKCWVTSKNIQNNAILRKWSNYNELHRFDVKTINNVELRRKTFKTTLNYKSAQTTMTCIDLMTKRS